MSSTHKAYDLVVYWSNPNGGANFKVLTSTIEYAKRNYAWRAIELKSTAQASRKANMHMSFSAWVKHRLQELLTTEIRFNIGANAPMEDDMAILQPNGLPFPTAQTVGPRRDPPALPLEVFNTQPVDGNKAMDVTRVLCGGDAKPWRELNREGN